MYMAGLSYRAMTERTGLVPASHVAVHYWVRSLKSLTRMGGRRERRLVAVDETRLKVNGSRLFVWAAIDVDSREVLALDASWQRSALIAWLFLGRVLKACSDNPLILVDGGPWYSWALRELGLPWRRITYGMRNRVERWFRTLKVRTRGFYNNFPSRKRGI
jgi:transposase-like protein